jgi:hypothetical protein
VAQRGSGYERKADEEYQTPPWATCALLARLAPFRLAWDPCAAGGNIVSAIQAAGFKAIGTRDNFYAYTKPPHAADCLITNPPYGVDRRGAEAVKFIQHALPLVPRVAMLLRNDFDSALGRQALFRENKAFAGKVTLLNRIKWFDGPSSPSDNHSWFLWDRTHQGPPIIRYVGRREVEGQHTAYGKNTAQSAAERIERIAP